MLVWHCETLGKLQNIGKWEKGITYGVDADCRVALSNWVRFCNTYAESVSL